MNQLLHKLWLLFWQLLPANPILVRVVHGASRRQRHLLLRFGYLTALFLVVVFALFLSMSGQSTSLAELAKGASQTFKWASMAQLAMMCFLAPAFTAAAITQERDAQTYNILLSTPLSSAQIVFGSLMSRLYFVIMLLIAGVPIFLMTMLYGGVTTSQVMESFMLSAATAVLTGALAIFVAMMGVGTRRTIFSFYLLIALYLLGMELLGQWDGTAAAASPPNLDGKQMSWLTFLHPFLALDVALNRVYAPPETHLADFNPIARYALAHPSAAYVTWTLLLALVLTTTSILFVRSGARQGEPRWYTSSLTKLLRRDASGERRRSPRTVWGNPVAWREAKTRAAGGGGVRALVIVAGSIASLALLISYFNGAISADQARAWLADLIAIQFALLLLVATNTAATSMTKEKESKTMDLLLTTPLTSRYVLFGKLRGLVSFAAPLLAAPVITVFVFSLYGLFARPRPAALWLETAVTLAALLLVYTAGACVIGLRMSLHTRKNVTAVMYSVGMVVLVGGGASGLAQAFVTAAHGEFGAFVAPFAPFTAIAYIVDPSGLFDNARDFAVRAPAARVSSLVGCTLAVAGWGFVVWSIYTSLVRNFDMTLRRQSGL